MHKYYSTDSYRALVNFRHNTSWYTSVYNSIASDHQPPPQLALQHRTTSAAITSCCSGRWLWSWAVKGHCTCFLMVPWLTGQVLSPLMQLVYCSLCLRVVYIATYLSVTKSTEKTRHLLGMMKLMSHGHGQTNVCFLRRVGAWRGKDNSVMFANA